MIRILFMLKLAIEAARAMRGPQPFAYAPIPSGRHRTPYIAPRAGRAPMAGFARRPVRDPRH